MKPFICKRNGKWLVFRSKFASTYTIPVVGASTLAAAWASYLDYNY